MDDYNIYINNVYIMHYVHYIIYIIDTLYYILCYIIYIMYGLLRWCYGKEPAC